MSVTIIASHQDKSSYIIPVTLVIDKWIFQSFPHFHYIRYMEEYGLNDVQIYDRTVHKWISIYEDNSKELLKTFYKEHPNFKNYYHQCSTDAFFKISENTITEIEKCLI